MAAAGVLELTDANFESEVLQSDAPVLVDFWAPWCGPCRMIAPTIDEIAGEGNGTYKVGKLNVDEAPNTSVKYGISGIPSILVFKSGEVVQRFQGVTGKDELVKALHASAGS